MRNKFKFTTPTLQKLTQTKQTKAGKHLARPWAMFSWLNTRLQHGIDSTHPQIIALAIVEHIVVVVVVVCVIMMMMEWLLLLLLLWLQLQLQLLLL